MVLLASCEVEAGSYTELRRMYDVGMRLRKLTSTTVPLDHWGNFRHDATDVVCIDDSETLLTLSFWRHSLDIYRLLVVRQFLESHTLNCGVLIEH